MISFEYAQPRTEAEAVEQLSAFDGETAILAGGTDLYNLLRADAIAPRRVVDIRNLPEISTVTEGHDGLLVGAAITLDQLRRDPRLLPYASLQQVAEAHHAIQIQHNGTLGGDLCHLPNCWYYRNGHGLLAMQDGRSLVLDGRNQFHAILGNRGPAKFLSASRFAPALIALGAKVRVVGPSPEMAELLPLDAFYVTPKTEKQGVTVLKPGQFVSHIWLPRLVENQLLAAYEVLQMEGLDWPLAAAGVSLLVNSFNVVMEARVVLGHVAPTPWISAEAARTLIGQPLTEEIATLAATAAMASATPLSENEYKVSIARAAVKRAILRAAGVTV
jgi:xanthine dehydrogenase YagS FAD-binding subunit